MAADPLNSAHDLMRRLPPSRTADSINDVLDIAGDEAEWAESFLGSVDAPLRVAKDSVNGTPYLVCDYNRDGDSYRSPWSNTYDPPMSDGSMPSASMRDLEVRANDVFSIYRELYFESGVSSAYFWEVDDSTFASAWLIKKVADTKRGLSQGGWDGIHVFEVQHGGQSSGTARYKLTSTVLVSIGTDSAERGTTRMGGSTTKQVENDLPFDETVNHVVNMGTMLEAMETTLRLEVQGVCFDKTTNITDHLHKCVDKGKAKARANEHAMVAELLGKMKAK
eukprot:TRINITY_DN11600_c0_g2_i1.p1 TRINITY_DN11600_c0_g2~~TRINITY_DN11600_c0_g2_i1.p1  ORF type:complete len:279 (+),score=73.19 TRINITY_DN11600_c0_g2_i1:49-885(+)